MSKILDYDDYMYKRVEIIYANRKQGYHKLLNMKGTVMRVSSGEIGVMVDDMENGASQYGVYWFKRHELKIVEEEVMTGFNSVAIVNLLEDYNKKDYGFALYDEDFKLFKSENQLVVVNPKYKDSRVLGIVKDVVSVEEYNKNVTAQVVGVVNMDRYNYHIEEEKRIAEIKKKKAAIELELEKEISKRKTMEFYKKMAMEYSDNPRLAELVSELELLSE